MQNFDLENIKSHPSLSLAKVKVSRDLQINFNQAEDPLTISTKSRGDNKCGSATQSGRSLLPESGADAPTVLSAVYTDSTPAKNRQADVPQYGRSMIEMLGVLAIIGVLSVGGIAGYSKAMQKYRINKTIEQITLIAGNVRTFFAPQRNYSGIDCQGDFCDATNGCSGHSGVDSNGNPTYAENGCPIIKKAKILPDEMITLNDDGKITAITNPFGGAVNLSYDHKYTYGDYQAFYINYQIDNEEACIELTSHDWTTANVGVIHFFNDGLQASGKADFKPPMDIDTAVERCSAFFKASNKIGSSQIGLNFSFDVDVNSTYWQSKLNPSS